MYRDPRSDMPVTQYSLKWVEPAGLVKFDFLGLKTLTVLDNAVKMINRNGTKFALTDIPIDDAPTFEKLHARATWSACSRWKARACGAPWSTCGRTGSRT